jgi:repressor LexA
MLTKPQRDLLAFIAGYADANEGMAPTFAEMADGVGRKSKSSIHRLLKQLEARGSIRSLPNRARAIEVLKRPEPTEPTESPIDRARRNLAIALRALQDAAGAPFGVTLAVIAIKTAIVHLGPGKGEAK